MNELLHPVSTLAMEAPPTVERAPRDVLVRRFSLASATLALTVVAIALVVLVGWLGSWDAVHAFFPGFGANTALALLFTGGGLWVYRTPNSAVRDSALAYLTGAAACIALLTAFEHVTGWNLRIDQLLVSDHVTGGPHPGRMALVTAFSLLLVNAAMFVADRPGRRALSHMLIATAIVIATLNTVAHVFGTDLVPVLDGYGRPAIHPSMSILFICFGFIFARPDEGVMNAVVDVGAGGLVVRQLLPVVFVLPLVVAWLAWQGVRAGWYEPGVAMAVFVTLAMNLLAYAVWIGGRVLHGFDEKRLSAEAERSESEARMRRAVTGAPVPMIIHDDEDHILHMSHGWSLYSGYTAAEAPTISAWAREAHIDRATELMAYFRASADATDTIHGGEWPLTTKAGESRTWEISTTPLGNLGSGRHVSVTVGVDVTERKQAEADLRRMNEELEERIAARTAELTLANDSLKRQSDQVKEQATLLDLVRDAILVRDLYGTIVYWSAGATDMYGWGPDEALKRVSHRLLQAEYPRPLSDIERHVIANGYWEGEVGHTTRTGTRLSIESRWTLTRNDRGIPQGFLEVNRDITARKRGEDSLKDSEARFRALAETAIEGIISIDAAGTIGYWNPGAERLFGRPAAEAVGQPATIALPEHVLSVYRDGGGAPVVGSTFETVGQRRDGSQFPIELSLQTWATSQGARIYTAIARDITERKNAERALEAKADELSRSNRELEQFAYVASHDLQEPLRMVSNYTHLLARRYKDQLDSDANDFIEFAVDGAKRMQELIHDLLQYARVGTRGKEFKLAPADGIAADALQNLASAVEESGATVTVEPLPMLFCDQSQLVQVFQNLVGNAIKFRRPDSHPLVKIAATHTDGVSTIVVSDDGIGIDPKHFERIFQMFQRLHGRGEYEGTGIGLALCRKIVERHGGQIRVASEPGRGATFSFTIPDAPRS